jgi:hypothetical protein
LKIEIGQRWFCVSGQSNDAHIAHRVVDIKGSAITTWSEPIHRPDGGGFSWHGLESEFRKQFVQLQPNLQP